ncbi:glutaconyl-CoA decarboxylase subunit beta [Clostridium argentinense CDC 2741]|uniref:Glutaconyl-CoA decarboxylase subunit beta n=1 Tax=Clostridium argentinense CDC 2741 TaxID=1418104 RepID=A0A0C1UEB0_9CLOT|nr:sodium ion-translocating decarboxylase subunit beta [Clostridium argentinense]ARC83626.1 glutaconyl-CoA decarboxylase subunit beta [Clostridium argentinense]KIE45745.1 glutaconyl-CoA decarboxylase subunit beta [Clostridium argentinense CDC 2741]NFF41681.1 sodium ion-translocating decarboxylase subunit beta [Clostridium argentinense]NFP52407.1 sodium ion-translocating decarboxylase subunit beta [Clostridium argentinense]NFP74722.1 sodium ion-translocating decarboxylase subunit beta [Clostrid
MNIIEVLQELLSTSGFAAITWKELLMIGVSCLLIYLAIAKEFEPLLLLPIAFGMLLTNLPLADIMAEPVAGEAGGLLYYLSRGVKLEIFPPLIFLGVGAMTDFGPLLANPSSVLMGAGAQFGVFFAFMAAILLGFTPQEAASIGIIGGADGPTAIFLTNKLAPHLLGPIAVAAYSYMALVPLIQPPIMKALTTKEERKIKMGQLRQVKKVEKVIFPIVVAILVILFLPSLKSLVGMLMLGNLFKESGVVGRLSDTAQNALINIITIFLGLSVGATAKAEIFLTPKTIGIIILGVVAFAVATASGVIIGKIMCKITKGKINPLIGSAGVSAVPMAARVSQVVGQKEDPSNFLLMNAMGPNVAGVIGSAVAAGVLLSMFG